MSRPADPTRRFVPALAGVGGAALAAITLVYPGATRMHAWPWSLAFAVVLVVPPVILLAQFATSRPALPVRAWRWTACVAATVILLSGLGSPFRGPSLWWSAPLLSAIAAFFAAVTWFQSDPARTAIRRDSLLEYTGWLLAAALLNSLGHWAWDLPSHAPGEIFAARNNFPLGHSNYTAGLALLALPCFVALARRRGKIARILWSAAGILAVVQLFTSGSRGGILGLAALLLVALLLSGVPRRVKALLAFGAIGAAALLALANPRIRALLQPAETTQPNASTLQRVTMLDGGLALGRERSLLGWGPGTTPLAFPKVAAQTPGGVEDVLQLHSLPVQLWAELGSLGVVVAAVALVLVARQRSRHPLAVAAAAGYLVFAFTDYQLDVPVFALALAFGAAWLAPIEEDASVSRLPLLVLLIGGSVALAWFARPDPAPALNLRALELAGEPTHRAEAIALFKRSLALNDAQEIAHFNLGWLEVVDDPRDAERHFLGAAALVPDKGGVWFGLGLARLNQGRRAEAVEALATECVNDPVFFLSPWWRNPAFTPLRADTFARARALLAELRRQAPALAAEASYVSELSLWLEGKSPASAVAAAADTPERRDYFSREPSLEPLLTAPIVAYRRERSGYPVLMRNLDLPPPTDLFDVQENSLATGSLRFLFPAKGSLSTRRAGRLLL